MPDFEKISSRDPVDQEHPGRSGVLLLGGQHLPSHLLLLLFPLLLLLHLQPFAGRVEAGVQGLVGEVGGGRRPGDHEEQGGLRGEAEAAKLAQGGPRLRDWETKACQEGG